MKALLLDANREVELYEIASQMKTVGLSAEFITAAVRTASEFEGVYDLMKLWQDETETAERDEIIADIQDMIDDCSQEGKTEAPTIRFDDLETIAADIRKFKDNLRVIVDQFGGIKYLSEVTGIPQPSLSRFFNSGSMPRRTTLNKIAIALKLDAVKVVTGWDR